MRHRIRVAIRYRFLYGVSMINPTTEERSVTTLKDYQVRIPLTELQEGDFLDVIEPLPPARGARGGVRGMNVGSKVTSWDVLTGVLETVATRGMPIRLRYVNHTVIIRKRVEAAAEEAAR